MAEKLSKYNKAGDEITKYGFISNMEAFIGKLISGQITAQTNDYLQSHGIDREVALTNLLSRPVKDDPTSAVLSRKESIKTDKETNKDKFHVKYTLIDKKNVEKKLRNIYIKLFEYHIADNPILNEEMDMASCANIVGVVGGMGKQVGSEMCDRWAGYVNDGKDKPHSIFKDEDKMKEEILNSEDGETYKTRGGMKGIDECDCGACDGGGEAGGFSAGANSAEASGQYTTPLFGVMRRKIGRVSDKKDGTEDVRMPDMLKECVKTVYLTESQINIIKKELLKEDGVETGLYGGFEFGYTAPAFSDKATRDHKNMFAKSWSGRIGKKRKKKKSKKH